jgi:hypothetical protein
MGRTRFEPELNVCRAAVGVEPVYRRQQHAPLALNASLERFSVDASKFVDDSMTDAMLRYDDDKFHS